MPLLTTVLIPGGFQILANGVPWIHQTHRIDREGLDPIPDGEREEQSIRMLARLQHTIDAPQYPERPTLAFESIAIDPDHAKSALVDIPAGEITMPMGASIVDSPQGLGRLLDASGATIPLDANFRVPIQPTDASGTFNGQADYVVGTITQGVLHSAWKPSRPGRYVLTAETLNAGLPEASRMQCRGLTIYVMQTP